VCEVDPLDIAETSGLVRDPELMVWTWIPLLWRHIHSPPTGYPSRKGGPAMPPFDPQVFLAKVNGGGRAISDYRKDQIVFRQGDPSDAVFYIQSGKVKKTVVIRAGEGSRRRTSRCGRFLWRRLLSGRAAASVDGFRSDEMCDRANIEGRNHSRDPRRAGVCRVIYLAPPGPQRSYRRGPGRSTVQFQREASRADTSASGEFWQGGSAGADHSKSQPGDACRDDRNDSVPREFLHE